MYLTVIQLVAVTNMWYAYLFLFSSFHEVFFSRNDFCKVTPTLKKLSFPNEEKSDFKIISSKLPVTNCT